MASMVAVFPRSARSMMSAPARGRRRTRSPGFRSTPAALTFSSLRFPPKGSQLSTAALPGNRPEAAERAVEPQELLLRQRLGPLQEEARPLVRRCHGLPLLVGQGQDAQGED